MTKIAIDDKLAKETVQLSGLSLEEAAANAFRGYISLLRLQELRGKFEKDDWWDNEPEKTMAEIK
jgi:Arc/MetJ family transcription regulator